MTPLAGALGLGERELVSLVGGGGKSTLLFALGTQLAESGKQVMLTTTTKMGRAQALAAPSVCWSARRRAVEEALDGPGPVMVVTGGDSHKVTGPPPGSIDVLYETLGVDYIIVEADGSRGRPLKAPAAHEPVIPDSTSTVVILMGIDAVGRRLDQVVHRVEEAAAFSGLRPDAELTVGDCAEILLHPGGALRACPPAARVVVGLTKVATPEESAAAGQLRSILSRHERIDTIAILTEKQYLLTDKQ